MDSSSSAHVENQANSVITPPTPESGQTDSAQRINVVIRQRTEKHTMRPPTPLGAVLVEIKAEPEQEQRLPVATVSPAPTDNERPGPSVPREPPVYQTPEQTRLEALVKGVVSFLISTS